MVLKNPWNRTIFDRRSFFATCKQSFIYSFIKVLDHFPLSQLVVWVLSADIVLVQTACFANNGQISYEDFAYRMGLNDTYDK